MNQHETVFILTPVLSDEQMKETVAKFKTLLTDKGAEILNEETWGLKKMAYAIQKKSTGFYCMMEFKAEPSVIKSLETGFRRDEKVIRFMTVKLDKYAVQGFPTKIVIGPDGKIVKTIVGEDPAFYTLLDEVLK